jgi:paraquat-inducible protein B
MSNQKNTSFAIGAFLVGALVLVFSALLFFSSGQLFSTKERVIMYFDGSVQGLQTGAPVKLKGVQLGEITDIEIDFDEETQTIVNAITADLVLSRISHKGEKVDASFLQTSIDNGMRAQLNYLSLLTGMLYIELDFHPEAEAKLFNPNHKYLEIPTIATDFEKITRDLQSMNFEALVNNLDQLIFKINQIASSGRIEETLSNISGAAESFETTSKSIDSELKELAKNINTTSIQISTLLETVNKQAPDVSKNLNQNLITLQQSLDQFNQTASTLNHTLSDDAPLVYQLNTTLKDISESARAFRTLSETLEAQPEAILRGKSTFEVK